MPISPAAEAAQAVRAGTEYIDVGTLQGYREAVTLLAPPGLEASAA
jgi:hypothetical protein